MEDGWLKPSTGRDNRFKWWGGRKDKKFLNEAAGRLKHPGFLEISHTPKFRIPRDSKVFTIGSCFARNIERKLMENGVEVLSRGLVPHHDTYRATDADPNAAMNKFTPHSISHEMSRALGGETPPDRGLIDAGDGLWWDPQASFTMPTSREAVLAIRDQIEAITRRVDEADVVLITLGLTETWLDSETGIYLNGQPSGAVLTRYPDRFKFANVTHDQAVQALRDTLSLVRQHGKPGVKFILTVSPVALAQTFTMRDVIVANSHSKAVLLSAIDGFVSVDEDVDYFPSFEMVMYSPRQLAWEEDQRHVTDAMVGHVTDFFVQEYLSEAR